LRCDADDFSVCMQSNKMNRLHTNVLNTLLFNERFDG